MEIKKYNTYISGTIEIETDKGVFCFDDRLGSSTIGQLFLEYPKNDNSNLIKNPEKIIKEIIEALKIYKDGDYLESVEYSINKSK